MLVCLLAVRLPRSELEKRIRQLVEHAGAEQFQRYRANRLRACVTWQKSRAPRHLPGPERPCCGFSPPCVGARNRSWPTAPDASIARRIGARHCAGVSRRRSGDEQWHSCRFRKAPVRFPPGRRRCWAPHSVGDCLPIPPTAGVPDVCRLGFDLLT